MTCYFCAFLMTFVVFVFEGQNLKMFESIKIKVVHTKQDFFKNKMVVLFEFYSIE
jgi:hypothetical protein